MGEQIHSSIILGLVTKVSGQLVVPVVLPQAKKVPVPKWLGVWVASTAGLDTVEKGIYFALLRNQTQAAQPVARRYTPYIDNLIVLNVLKSIKCLNYSVTFVHSN
jgi:hypothetical protein